MNFLPAILLASLSFFSSSRSTGSSAAAVSSPGIFPHSGLGLLKQLGQSGKDLSGCPTLHV
jgi:hypothetical protein